MAVARKPKAHEKAAAAVDVDALIAKGGDVAGRSSTDTDAIIKTIPLRVSADLLARVNASVQAQPIKTPRNTWLLHAIMEKLERDET